MFSKQKLVYSAIFLNFLYRFKICSSLAVDSSDLDYYLVAKKLTIDLGAKELFCIHQQIENGYDVFVFAKVVGQANRMIGLEIESMSGHVLFPFKWDDELSHNFKTAETGDYKFCLTNANFAETRIFLSVNGMNAKKYMDQLKDISEREKLEEGISKSFGQLMTNIVATAHYLNYLNQHSLKDAKLVESNYNYVNTWSFLQCCAILIVGYIQLYIMKRLFATSNVTPTGKPRA